VNASFRTEPKQGTKVPPFFMLNPAAQKLIFTSATTYLKDKNNELRIPAQWLSDIEQSIDSTSNRPGAQLRWLRAQKGPKTHAGSFDPSLSHPYVRRAPDGSESWLLVLLASLFWRDRGNAAPPRQLNGGQGLRVIARLVRDAKPGNFRIPVMTASTSLPAVAADDVTIWNDILADFDVAYLLDDHSGSRWPVTAGLDPNLYGTYSVGLRLDDPSDGTGGIPSSRFLARLIPRRIANATKSSVLDAPAYAVEATVRSGGGAVPELEGLHRYPLFAQLTKKAFERDPPTKLGSRVLCPDPPPVVPPGRPKESRLQLDKFRVLADLGRLPRAGAGRHKLSDPTRVAYPNGRFFVAQSRHVEGGRPGFNENAPVVIADAADYSSRTDGFAAVNAYLRAGEFFWRIDDLYGLPMNEHFAFAQLPLIVRYRAGIVPGAGDGRTINAQVRWAPTTPPTAFPSKLEVRLALADLQSNEGRVNAVRRTGRVRRAPLSIAAAQRWCWHEFGHVLIAGATGDLELEFAHSVGDALGAILCDPRSQLAKERSKPAWRGVTFPWQSLPNRRHDHEATDGWSWSGTHARPNRFFAGHDHHHVLNRGGYCSEQLVSSTLFRLYRSLGGDAERSSGAVNEFRRIVAAEHTTALIMAAIGIFGPSTVSVVRTAEEFAGSLYAADSGMLPLAITAGGITRTRYGGMANKVVRWAFEQQGAFPPAGAPAWAHNAPGLAPASDVFVASRRAGERGGYSPVTFADDAHLADRSALWVRRNPAGSVHQEPKGGADNFVFVRVGNRGQNSAANTTVRVWSAQLTIGGRIPRWTDAAWTELKPVTAGDEGPKDIPVATIGVRFGPFRWSGAASTVRYALLVAATCPSDPSNLDFTPSLPCATAPCDVNELAAFDNNLGVILVRAV
jgi:hypothetical protein